MKVIEITSVTLQFNLNEFSIPLINKGDLIGYRGDIYKVYEIDETDKELFIKLELMSRCVNIYAIDKENHVEKLFDYNLNCKKERNNEKY